MTPTPQEIEKAIEVLYGCQKPHVKSHNAKCLENRIALAIHEARINALEEAAKIAIDWNAEHESGEKGEAFFCSEGQEIAKVIRAMQEGSEDRNPHQMRGER